MKSTRRQFLKTSLYTGAAAISMDAKVWAQAPGANSAIRAAVVGVNGRGEAHISGFGKVSGVRLIALCDADAKVLAAKVDKAKRGDADVEGYSDMRKLLERKDLDVVGFATPNHWHSLGAIWAIQAGKDVYVEKPVSHNVSEGRRVVEFARKHNRIVQTGTQSRSSREGILGAINWMREGHIGKLLIARGLCYKPRVSIGKVDGPQKPPGDVDYDMWSGPARMLPIMRKKFHYDWHWQWEYGNGDLGNQGIHQMDICRWFLGEMELAPKVISVGGRFGYEDDGETANTQIVYQDYAKAPLIFEVRGLPRDKESQKGGGWGAGDMDKLRGSTVGCVIECEGGYISVPSYVSSVAYDKDGNKLKEWKETKGEEGHFANFIKAVKSRKIEDLNADILEGHLSSALCHTGNISYRLGKKAGVDEIKQIFSDRRGLGESWERMAAHLDKNGVDLAKERVQVGVPLEMNTKTEKFIANEAANEMLTRPYRQGYVVPAKA